MDSSHGRPPRVLHVCVQRDVHLWSWKRGPNVHAGSIFRHRLDDSRGLELPPGVFSSKELQRLLLESLRHCSNAARVACRRLARHGSRASDRCGVIRAAQRDLVEAECRNRSDSTRATAALGTRFVVHHAGWLSANSSTPHPQGRSGDVDENQPDVSPLRSRRDAEMIACDSYNHHPLLGYCRTCGRYRYQHKPRPWWR